jgi:hypothetical protein
VEECFLRKELETHPKKKIWKENKKNRLGGQSLQSRMKFSGGARFSRNILPDNACQVTTGEGKKGPFTFILCLMIAIVIYSFYTHKL